MSGQDIFLRNNTGNKSKSNLIEGFIVRTGEFDKIRHVLEQARTANDLQNTIIIGQRGAGKTTLMHRLNYAILDNKPLSNRYLPILFSEEQYNLSDLTNLWEAVAVGIEDNFYKENLVVQIEDVIESIDKDYKEKSFELLRDFLMAKRKIAILFIENMNFFLKKLSEDEKRQLKKILTTNLPFRVIGSSTTYNDGSIDFGDPFYDFLKVVQLDGLNKEECEKLLIKIGQQYGEERQIREVISNFPARVEALRRLTGGVPRTISYLFQIFLDNENGKAIKDLYLLIDTLTLLYKSELDQLSTQQQKVIDTIARKWDAISVKEIAKRTRLESKNISSILSYLEKNQQVEKVSTSTKNHLYRIKDRFMNIWYLMRFGRKYDKENVIWLVRFFDAWCDESELTQRLRKHINNLKDGKYDTLAAIDMGNTFLSCENVSDSLKEELIKTTNSILPDRLLKNTKTSQKDSLAIIKKLARENKIDEAEKRLKKIETRNLDFYMLATSIYLIKGEQNKALEYAKAAWELDNKSSLAATSMGLLYELYLGRIEKAIQFYKKGLELPQPHPYAANRLGIIYSDKKDYKVAIKYHKQAASKSIKGSLKSLGEIYLTIGQPEKAEKYLKEAADAKIEGANTALAKLFASQKKRKETELALQAAIKSNEEGANINLGRFYLMQKKPSFKKAEEQFKIAIEKGFIHGYSEFGKLLLQKKSTEQAIEVFKKGILNKDSESAHHLGHLYNTMEEFDAADGMFERAIELGDPAVVGCWVQGIYRFRRTDKKTFAKQLLEKYGNDTYNIQYDLLYAKILLWNEEVIKSLKIINNRIREIFECYDEEENNRSYRKALSELVDYFVLLIAKKEFNVALNILKDSDNTDFKRMLKPVYYLLMEELKDEFPTEHLKAGKELTETINELRKEVEYLREVE